MTKVYPAKALKRCLEEHAPYTSSQDMARLERVFDLEITTVGGGQSYGSMRPPGRPWIFCTRDEEGQYDRSFERPRPRHPRQPHAPRDNMTDSRPQPDNKNNIPPRPELEDRRSLKPRTEDLPRAHPIIAGGGYFNNDSFQEEYGKRCNATITSVIIPELTSDCEDNPEETCL